MAQDEPAVQQLADKLHLLAPLFQPSPLSWALIYQGLWLGQVTISSQLSFGFFGQ